MFEFIADRVNDSHFMFSLLLAVAVAATVLTIAMPLLVSDTLDKRMKAVAVERDRIRSRERERLQTKSNRVSLRQEPRVFMKQIVDSFNLSRWLGTDQAKTLLAQAGYRGQQAEIAFLFFRLVLPIALFFLTLFYLFVIRPFDYPATMLFGGAVAGAWLGIKTPEFFLKNTIQKRRLSMRRAFPDALDLLLICVESGNSIEHAFRKVSAEIGSSSVPLAEEFTLTTAELSYLQDRRIAYENLGLRTGLDSIRQVVTVLIQSERYGTPLGSALRVASQESRDARLMEAEKKAAALPPKLTVPMIIFFLPVLFAVILTPAIIQVMAVNK